MSINNFNIQNAIKKLWDTNLYLDIRIDVDKKYLSNRLMIYVEEAPFINQIVFNGNKKVTNKKLIEEFSVKKGDLLNYNDINEAIISIENYYKNKNYHNVVIDYKIQSPEDKNQLIKVARKDVIVDIYEGKKIKLKDVIIEGNNSFSDKILIKQFQDLKIWKWYAPWKGDFDEEKYNINKLILEDFYFNKGYKDFHINKDSVIYEDDRINIYLSIEEGVEYFVREISWDGNVIKTDSI